MTGDIICCLSVLGEPIIGRGSGRRAAALCRILKRRKNSFENTKTGKTREKYRIKIANSLIINVIGNLFWVPGRTRTVDIQNHNLSCIVIYPVDFHQVNELSIRSSVNYK